MATGSSGLQPSGERTLPGSFSRRGYSALIAFKPWKPFKVDEDPKAARRFLRSVALESKKSFREGIEGPKSGRWYARRPRRSSAPGEFPASQTGRLLRSVRSEYNDTSATVGSSVPHSKWLREGTRFMQPRQMSVEALREGFSKSRHLLKRMVGFTRGEP